MKPLLTFLAAALAMLTQPAFSQEYSFGQTALSIEALDYKDTFSATTVNAGTSFDFNPLTAELNLRTTSFDSLASSQIYNGSSATLKYAMGPDAYMGLFVNSVSNDFESYSGTGFLLGFGGDGLEGELQLGEYDSGTSLGLKVAKLDARLGLSDNLFATGQALVTEIDTIGRVNYVSVGGALALLQNMELFGTIGRGNGAGIDSASISFGLRFDLIGGQRFSTPDSTLPLLTQMGF